MLPDYCLIHIYSLRLPILYQLSLGCNNNGDIEGFLNFLMLGRAPLINSLSGLGLIII